MFLKLNFNSATNFANVRQIINGIINNQNITSIPTLISESSSWNANILSTFNYTSSEIVRTVSPTLVKSHLADESTSYNWTAWTLEFQVYDAPSRKYYISVNNNTASTASSNNTATISLGDTILSGSMDSNNAPMTTDLSVVGTQAGTAVRLSSTAPANVFTGGAAVFPTASYDNIRTFWMYLTNECLIFSATHGTSSNLGFNATYSNTSAYTGPWIFSQYQRYDYHNTDSNGVIPLMFTNIARAVQGVGFGYGNGTQSDWDRAENVNFNNGGTIDTAFRVFNFIDAHPQVGTSWPLTSFPQVNWGSGSRTTEIAALTAKSVLDTATSTSTQIPRLIHTTSQTRYPSTDLRSVGYGMLPLRWSNSYRFNRGGNATARGGFYIFNGEYFPGDTFTHGGKTYMIWPTYFGYTGRVGLAIPKE